MRERTGICRRLVEDPAVVARMAVNEMPRPTQLFEHRYWTRILLLFPSHELNPFSFTDRRRHSEALCRIKRVDELLQRLQILFAFLQSFHNLPLLLRRFWNAFLYFGAFQSHQSHDRTSRS